MANGAVGIALRLLHRVDEHRHGDAGNDHEDDGAVAQSGAAPAVKNKGIVRRWGWVGHPSTLARGTPLSVTATAASGLLAGVALLRVASVGVSRRVPVLRGARLRLRGGLHVGRDIADEVFRLRDDVHISHLYWAVFRGGATQSWAGSRDSWIDFDNVRITTNG